MKLLSCRNTLGREEYIHGWVEYTSSRHPKYNRIVREKDIVVFRAIAHNGNSPNGSYASISAIALLPLLSPCTRIPFLSFIAFCAFRASQVGNLYPDTPAICQHILCPCERSVIVKAAHGLILNDHKPTARAPQHRNRVDAINP